MKTSQQHILHRLRIIAGHIQKVSDMVEVDAYCMDVLHQTGAVKRAIESLEQVVLENHLRSCVKEAMKNGTDEEKIITELLDSFKAHNK